MLRGAGQEYLPKKPPPDTTGTGPRVQGFAEDFGDSETDLRNFLHTPGEMRSFLHYRDWQAKNRGQIRVGLGRKRAGRAGKVGSFSSVPRDLLLEREKTCQNPGT